MFTIHWRPLACDSWSSSPYPPFRYTDFCLIAVTTFMVEHMHGARAYADLLLYYGKSPHVYF